MELRFLKGNWEFGKYKLQYMPFHGEDGKKVWADVPMAEDKPKEKSLEEKFTDYMNTFSTHIKVKHYHDKENRVSDEQVFHKAQFEFISEKLAEIAEQHFAEKKS